MSSETREEFDWRPVDGRVVTNPNNQLTLSSSSIFRRFATAARSFTEERVSMLNIMSRKT